MPFQALSGSECLAATIAQNVARVVIDNPHRRNAVDLAGWRALAALVPELAARNEVRVIVLAGAGSDFSAGADISEFDTVRRDAATARIYEAANSAAFAAIRTSAVPVIAAIRGVCFGGGFGLAAACDLRIATHDARFAVPAARLGLAYPQDAMVDIVSAAGAQMARYLTLTAQPIGAAQALAAGFLLETVADHRFDARVTEIAASIAASAPMSVKASRLSIMAVVTKDPLAARLAQEAGDATFDSADYAEGRAAFKQRRKPDFRGK
ncbi:MAG: enoyl-CoA hydratase-related protein [Mesorhizobium sp.]|nr:enoyl-CoA hydratase-related protein [Mesorhizobium sp.]MCO5163753.1 enoyl-CoA hydratase-related protein [Mesorhizobium sp.]